MMYYSVMTDKLRKRNNLDVKNQDVYRVMYRAIAPNAEGHEDY